MFICFFLLNFVLKSLIQNNCSLCCVNSLAEKGSHRILPTGRANDTYEALLELYRLFSPPPPPVGGNSGCDERNPIYFSVEPEIQVLREYFIKQELLNKLENKNISDTEKLRLIDEHKRKIAGFNLKGCHF